jgi:GntR family histidine utilization transcriptional repressor
MAKADARAGEKDENGSGEAALGGARRARGGESLHARIVSDLERRILSGEWPPGHRIPFEVELAERYGCSRMTMNKALGRLVDAGLIERRRKAGSFVSRPTSQAAILDIHDIRAEVEATGAVYRFEILERFVRSAQAADAARIESAEGAPLLALRCRHRAGEEPFCLEERLIDLTAVPDARAARFEELSPGAWLVAKVPWTNAEHRIGARAAGRSLARDLGVEEGAACLVVERRTWLSGAPITSVRLTYPGSAHRLVARFAPAS